MRKLCFPKIPMYENQLLSYKNPFFVPTNLVNDFDLKIIGNLIFDTTDVSMSKCLFTQN